MRDLLKGSLVIFIFKGLGASSLFLTHLLVAKYYGAETLGAFNLIIALVFIGGVVAKLGLDVYVSRVIPNLIEHPLRMAGFFKRVMTLLVYGGLVSCVLVIISADFLDVYIFKSFDALSYLYWLAFLMLPFAFFNVIPEVVRGYDSVKWYAFLRNTSQNLLMFLLLAVSLLVLNETPDPIYLLYMVVFSLSVFTIIYAKKFLKRKGVLFHKSTTYQDKVFAYSYPMLLTSSIMFLMGSVDSFMISYYLNEKSVGIYSVCLKITMLIPFLLESINGYIAPKFALAFAEKATSRLKKLYFGTVKLSFCWAVLVFFVIVLYGDFFLSLFGSEFEAATYVLWTVGLGYLISSLFGSIGYLMNLSGAQKTVSSVVFMVLIMNIVLNYSLIPLYGIMGAALATLGSTFCWNISLYLCAKRYGVLR